MKQWYDEECETPLSSWMMLISHYNRIDLGD